MKKHVKSSNMKRRMAFAQLDQAAGTIIRDDIPNADAPAKKPADRKGRRSKAIRLLLTGAAIAAH